MARISENVFVGISMEAASITEAILERHNKNQVGRTDNIIDEPLYLIIFKTLVNSEKD